MGQDDRDNGVTSFLSKSRLRKTGSLFICKKEEAAWSFLFLNNNDPDFCTLLFGKKPDFLKVQDPKKISGPPDKFDIRVQIDWLNMDLPNIHLVASLKNVHCTVWNALLLSNQPCQTMFYGAPCCVFCQ